MSILLFLSKVAITTKDEELKNDLNKVFNYVDKKGCAITTEIKDDCLLVYDTTNNVYLLKIKINIDINVNNIL